VRQSLKSALTYGAAFAAAAALHLALAAGLGRGLGSGQERAVDPEPSTHQEALAVTFRRPEAVTLAPKPAAAVTRLREPQPQPEPQPAVEVPPPSPQREAATDAAAVEEPVTELPEAPAPTRDFLEAPEAEALPPVRGLPAGSRAGAAPSARVLKPRPLAPIDAQAVYPLGSRLRGEEGAVRLSVRVDARGRVEHLEVVESSGFAALDRAAEKAVRYTRFVPATAGGRPVPDDLTITIRFRLDS